MSKYIQKLSKSTVASTRVAAFIASSTVVSCTWGVQNGVRSTTTFWAERNGSPASPPTFSSNCQYLPEIANVINVATWIWVKTCQNPIPLVNIKIAGKWMFIPLKIVLIGIDPYPHIKTDDFRKTPGDPMVPRSEPSLGDPSFLQLTRSWMPLETWRWADPGGEIFHLAPLG